MGVCTLFQTTQSNTHQPFHKYSRPQKFRILSNKGLVIRMWPLLNSLSLFLVSDKILLIVWNLQIGTMSFIANGFIRWIHVDHIRHGISIKMNLFLHFYLWCCGSGNIGENGLALMEAVHGTAPDIAGKVDNSTHSFDTCFVESA